LINRRLAFQYYHFVGVLPVWPLRLLYRWGIKSSVGRCIGPIGVVDFNQDDTDNVAFLQATVDAIELIEQISPRRHRLLFREIRYIVNAELNSGGCYDHFCKCIEVDFGKYHLYPESDDYGWYLARYAALLVHEATHGRIYAFRFPYVKQTRVQIERICRTEQRRFLESWSRGRFDISELSPEFDEKQRDYHWKSNRFRQGRDFLRRVRDSSGAHARNRRT
jgi:hypothetical protein